MAENPNNYEKLAAEILDIPLIAQNLGTNTLSNPSTTISPSGLTVNVTLETGNKKAVAFVSGGSFPNTYLVRVLMDKTNGAKRAWEFTVTMRQ